MHSLIRGVLAGVLEKVAARPAVLICGCRGPMAGRPPPLARKDREKGLIEAVKRTLRSEGGLQGLVDVPENIRLHVHGRLTCNPACILLTHVR